MWSNEDAIMRSENVCVHSLVFHLEIALLEHLIILTINAMMAKGGADRYTKTTGQMRCVPFRYRGLRPTTCALFIVAANCAVHAIRYTTLK